MRRQLSERASFVVAAAVVAHTLWTSTAPSMTYPVYAEQWQLSTYITTVIFAVYPVTVVIVMVVFGNLSDQIGRRRAMLYGVTASAAGVLLFAVAGNVTELLVGRVLMGVGVGLSAGPSAAALVDFAGDGKASEASTTTIVAQAFGFAAALLIGGTFTEYLPYPTRLSFVLLFVLLLGLLAAVWLIPEPAGEAPTSKWQPSLPHVPADIRVAFAYAALAVMTAYSHGVIIGSIGSQIASKLVESRNAFVNGVALALFPIALGAAGLVVRGWPATRAIAMGASASIAGSVLLIVAVERHGLASFVLATTVSGVGYALMVYGGIAVVAASTQKQVRGGVMSATLLFAYLCSGALALLSGRIASTLSMTAAALTASAIMVVLCLSVIGWTITRPPKNQSTADALSPR